MAPVTESLFLTDVTLCDATPAEAETLARGLAEEWRTTGLHRIEASLDSCSERYFALLGRTQAPLVVRCQPSPERVLEAALPGVVGITFWVESAASLARRHQGESHPAEAIRLRRAIQVARSSSLEVTVAFPLELERMRTLINFGYLAQSYGADRIRLVEKNGTVHPMDLFRGLRVLRERLSTTIELDFSDHWGLGVGAALCAMRAGVRHLAVASPVGEGSRRHVPLRFLRGCTELNGNGEG